ncbi:MAG: DUF488 domain-containing protein [Phycisphaeraceae bacterium]
MPKPAIQVKRVYEAPAKGDGLRVLVDRVWPRGMKKESAQIDRWLKEVAPSMELRKWFGHDPAKWREFKQRYHAELRERKETLRELLDEVKQRGGALTLVYSAKDEQHNNAVALREYLQRMSR